MSNLPIVCDLSATELSDRRDGLLARLAGSASEISEIENGVVLSLTTSPEITGLIAQVIEAERQCCRFLRFRCTYELDLGPISLEVTGPEGSREFLGEVLGLREKLDVLDGETSYERSRGQLEQAARPTLKDLLLAEGAQAEIPLPPRGGGRRRSP